jgi:predicted TIM-barrel fold metal-dependent hydrolase
MSILRLYLNGVFDRYPQLRLIIARPQRTFLDIWQHNLYLTTADILDLSSLRTLLEQIPTDRVLYATLYPLEERGRSLMIALRESEFLTDEEWDSLAWRNAEQLFKLKMPETGPYNVNVRTRAEPGQHTVIA